MPAQVVTMARRAALLTAAVAAVMLAVSVTGGVRGVVGAALAVVVVALFFGLTAVAMHLGARVSPTAMAGAGMATYFVKILALVILVAIFKDATSFSGVLFGLTVIVLVVAYQAALMVTWHRTRMLYVDPDGEG